MAPHRRERDSTSVTLVPRHRNEADTHSPSNTDSETVPLAPVVRLCLRASLLTAKNTPHDLDCPLLAMLPPHQRLRLQLTTRRAREHGTTAQHQGLRKQNGTPSSEWAVFYTQQITNCSAPKKRPVAAIALSAKSPPCASTFRPTATSEASNTSTTKHHQGIARPIQPKSSQQLAPKTRRPSRVPIIAAFRRRSSPYFPRIQRRRGRFQETRCHWLGNVRHRKMDRLASAPPPFAIQTPTQTPSQP